VFFSILFYFLSPYIDGAAIFLFDPCGDQFEIETFKKLAKNCLRRHVITPYNKLPAGQLFNIVTFGCRLEMNRVVGNEIDIKKYLRVAKTNFFSSFVTFDY
jgi:hypothetical protein